MARLCLVLGLAMLAAPCNARRAAEKEIAQAFKNVLEDIAPHPVIESGKAQCCCDLIEPPMKYLCIDRDDPERRVYGPASQKLLNENVDPRFMPETLDEAELAESLRSGRHVRSIPVTTRSVSRCANESHVNALPGIEVRPSTLEAVQLEYVGKAWTEYTLDKSAGGAYRPEDPESLIRVDGVVYAPSDIDLPTEGLDMCVQFEETAYLKHGNPLETFAEMFTGDDAAKEQCVERKHCQEYAQTHACGWGEVTGQLFKRVGKGGRCLGSDELIQQKEFGFFGSKVLKCPANMYHSVGNKIKELRGKGFLFCDCGGECTWDDGQEVGDLFDNV